MLSPFEWCVATSFYQRSANHVFFVFAKLILPDQTKQEYGIAYGIIQKWERIYLTEGMEGLAVERRDRGSTGRLKKLFKEVEGYLLAEVQRLHAENEYLKNLQALILERSVSGEKVLVVQKLRLKYSLSIFRNRLTAPCDLLLPCQEDAQGRQNADVKTKIATSYHENKEGYGYRRITMVLRSRGILLNHKTAQRIMRGLGLVCRVRIKKYCFYKSEVGKIAPNLLNRDFQAVKPSQNGPTDVTEFSLYGQKLYLSPILDLHNGCLVS